MIHSGTRAGPFLNAAVPFLLALQVLVAPSAASAERHPVIGLAIGIRSFSDDSGLGDDFAFGGKAGVNLTRRLGVVADYLASHPAPAALEPAVHVNSLRLLVRYNILPGDLRPYVIAGAGGVFYHPDGSSGWSVPAWTVGLGADCEIASRTSAFIEFSADRYSEQDISFDPDGEPVFSGDKRSRSLTALSAGITVAP